MQRSAKQIKNNCTSFNQVQQQTEILFTGIQGTISIPRSLFTSQDTSPVYYLY